MRELWMVSGLIVALCWIGFANPAENGQGGQVPLGNGDVNADGVIDINDPIYLLWDLFSRGPSPTPIECLPPAGKTLPATGQTKCYETQGAETDCDGASLRGQDGFYQAGCPTEGRFQDNGDGTVTDTCTGLMWQKDAADVSGDGSIGAEDCLKWQGALKYCEGLDLAGHSDWRLPNFRELLSIVDFGRAMPSIDPVFKATPSQTVHYWSSTTATLPRRDAMTVYFGVGNFRTHGKQDCGLLRAVRREISIPAGNGDVNGDGMLNIADPVHLCRFLFCGGPAPVPIGCSPAEKGLPATGQTKCYDANGDEIPCDDPEFPGQDGYYRAGCPRAGRFRDHGDGTVTDTCTGLMWQKEPAPDYYSWQGALQFCENWSVAGHNDWRLPNYRELESLFDWGRCPAGDPIFGLPTMFFWSSTTHLIGQSTGTRQAWGVYFDRCNITSDVKGSEDGCVRAVRSGP